MPPDMHDANEHEDEGDDEDEANGGRDARPLVTAMAVMAIAGAIAGEPLVMDRLRVVAAGLFAVAMVVAWVGTARMAAELLIAAGPAHAGLAFVLDAGYVGGPGLGWVPFVSLMTVLVGGGMLVLLVDGGGRGARPPRARARRRGRRRAWRRT